MFHFTKKKTIICVISLILSILCCFMTACCRKIYYWEVSQGIENISKIEIVEIEGDKVKSIKYEVEPIYYEEVIDDVQSLPAHKYFGSLVGARGNAIKITFKDDKFDIIAQYDALHVIDYSSEYLSGETQHYYYDKEDFEQLIEKWTNK